MRHAANRNLTVTSQGRKPYKWWLASGACPEKRLIVQCTECSEPVFLAMHRAKKSEGVDLESESGEWSFFLSLRIGLRENLNRKPWFLPLNMGVSCKFSFKPMVFLSCVCYKSETSRQMWEGVRQRIGEAFWPPAAPMPNASHVTHEYWSLYSRGWT